MLECFQGDCTRMLKALPDRSVDLVFADPPYNHAGRRAPVDRVDRDASSGIEEDFRFHESLIRECRRVLKENGSIWINGIYHSIYSCGFALQERGFHILNYICWYEPSAPPNLFIRHFAVSNKTLIRALKERDSRHTFNCELLKTGGRTGGNLKKAGRQMRTVWSVPSPRGREKRSGRHPTQKPCSLLKRIILASLREHGIVLDPFTGSSAMWLAACATWRRFIGIDTGQQSLGLSISRYRDSTWSRQENGKEARHRRKNIV